jgi:hypothetical protein
LQAGAEVEAIRPLANGRYQVFASGAASEPLDLVGGPMARGRTYACSFQSPSPYSGVSMVEFDDADLQQDCMAPSRINSLDHTLRSIVEQTLPGVRAARANASA